MEKIGYGSNGGNMTRYITNYEYFINSKGVEEIHSDKGCFVEKGKDYFSYPIKCSGNKKGDENFLRQECDNIKLILNRYKEICDKYQQYVVSLIEITLISREILIENENTSLYDKYHLYSINFKIFAKGTQQTYERGFGGKDDIGTICHLEEELESLLQVACYSGIRKCLQTGFYDVILDQEATGLFVHEFIGHLFEADNGLITYEDINAKRNVTNSVVSIVDDPTLKNGFGSYLFDDEGTISNKTYLIKNGKLNSLLHNKETSTLFNISSTANARAIDYSHKPIVRMSNTYMLPNKECSVETLFKGVEEGIYIKGTRNSYSGRNVFLGFREMYLIKDGMVCDLVANMKIVGNPWSVLSKIGQVANDLKIYGGGGGGCYKNSQGPLNVSAGGPHIKLNKVMLFPEFEYLKNAK